MDICIIGGGASGLMAAITAAEVSQAKITIIERLPRVGKKLLSTGNGRCNLTNLNLNIIKNYHGTNPGFAEYALNSFSEQDTLAFFRRIGLLTVSEPSGRVYPLTDRATSVLDVLRFYAEELGIKTIVNTEIKHIGKTTEKYILAGEAYKQTFDKVIVACGGEANSPLGGTNAGYELLSQLGHKIVKTQPALVQLKSCDSDLKSLKGIRADAAITVFLNGNRIGYAEGEVQFADNGLSGPAAFEISRLISVQNGPIHLCLDFIRTTDEIELFEMLTERRRLMASLPAESFLTGFLQSRIGLAVLKRANIDFKGTVGMLTEKQIRIIAAVIKNFEIHITGTMGLNQAQVTIGGVSTEGFNPKTMESLKNSGVFACGEVLDIDGDCGGYNLQWAWSSGYTAGLNAAK